jgi:phosphoribosyl 1,2-cyclic phosphate phosphodiesterase
VLVEHPQATIVIDTSPDLRAQFLDAGVGRLDAVLFTHNHADHTHGIDDLRFLRREPGASGAPIEAFADAHTMATLQRRFDYIFRQKEEGSGVLYRPFLKSYVFDGPFTVHGVPVTPFEQHHGLGTITRGFRIGGFAYSTDVVELPEPSLAALEGLDLWVVDCLRFEPHPTHAHFDRVMEWVARLQPKHTVLTHLNHQTDYDAVLARCPPGVEPAYDGMAIEIA